jgi:hypothetical protein
MKNKILLTMLLGVLLISCASALDNLRTFKQDSKTAYSPETPSINMTISKISKLT